MNAWEAENLRAENERLRAELAAQADIHTEIQMRLSDERDALRALLRDATAVLDPVSFNMYDHDIREAARIMVAHINAAMNKGGGGE